MKRIEIVVDDPHLSGLLEAVTEAGVESYTVLHHVEGRGDRGQQRADEVSGASSNAYVLIAISEEKLDQVLRTVQPLLSNYGGMCLVSDCKWLQH